MADSIRLVDPADAHAHSRLMSHAFGKGRVVTPPADDAPIPEHLAFTWGAYDNGRLGAALSVAPFTVCWPDPGPEPGDRVLKMGGIAGVATWADVRGKGLVDKLLRRSLEAMRDDGQVVSALYPFAFSFYRRYGWDWVGEMQEVTIPLRELPRRLPDGWSVAPLEGDDARDTLLPAYAAYARLYRGAFTPDSHKWNDHLNHSDDRTTYPYVCRDPEGRIAGYLLWRYPDSGDEGHVRLLVSRSADADAALLTLLRDFGMQCPKANLTLPEDFPIRSHLCTWEMDVKRNAVFMGRVVDLAAACAALSPMPVPDGAAVVAVADPHAPWNDGLWRIEAQGGQVRATAAPKGTAPDLTCDIAAFSQAFWGMPALPALRRAGRVAVAGDAAFAWLTRLLPAVPVASWDAF